MESANSTTRIVGARPHHRCTVSKRIPASSAICFQRAPSARRACANSTTRAWMPGAESLPRAG